MAFTVALIGRPNVGKSTLFNRLVGQKLALVDDRPGVTRDRRVHAARLQDLRFNVVDTAGLEKGEASSLAGRMRAQTRQAIESADVLLFLFDAKIGLTPADMEFAALIRKSGKPVVLVANKAEGRALPAGFYEAWQSGFGEPCAISAEHGLGLADLRDAVAQAVGEERLRAQGRVEEEERRAGQETALIGEDIISADKAELEENEESEEEEPAYDTGKPLRIAIIGRPNAGKSTLINTLLGEERLLTGPEAGLTRDSISVDWQWRGRKVKLFDTAGLRRKARISEKLEKLSVAETLRAIRFAEAVIIVIDATAPFEKQDLQIVDLVVREGRAPVIAFNKWDKIENRQQILAGFYEQCARLLPQISGVRAVPVSGAYGQGLEKLMENVEFVHKIWNRRLPTGRLNRWLAGLTANHPPPAVAGRRLKVKYITQVKMRPPGFMLSCSRPDAMPHSYLRYIVNRLRKDFDMPGVPVRLALKKAENPFAGRARKH
ncbi:ribosome biogenesis GTPase Der [Candidatus Tokpelaia sp.]|uniref:ribosome biogenesis GTPase Der n=1 Tax=Candidatus Tokpelaia sp. TaxID=2233777 RepID=UPI0012392D69|nr:ribosome biogenesis GTPase Der [Candidatus Tokpelaia sp.]KAA6405312.1 ribosome biogenesis GTPase Der [Candidatus Tokpelaia sp.]